MVDRTYYERAAREYSVMSSMFRCGTCGVIRIAPPEAATRGGYPCRIVYATGERRMSFEGLHAVIDVTVTCHGIVRPWPEPTDEPNNLVVALTCEAHDAQLYMDTSTPTHTQTWLRAHTDCPLRATLVRP